MNEGRLVVEKKGAVGWVVFDHVARRNAINGAMWRAIPAAMATLDAGVDLTVVDGRVVFDRGA